MKTIFISIFFLIFSSAQSQFMIDYLKAADQYFGKGDYYSAAQYYEKYLGIAGKGKPTANAAFNPYTLQAKSKKGGGTNAALSSKEQAVYNIAESYRQLNYPAKAEPAYKEIVDNSKEKFPLAQFHLATVLRALQKFDEAKVQFESFLNGYSNADNYKKLAEKELKSLEFIQKQMAKKDIDKYIVSKVIGGDVSNGANYASLFNNGKLYFTSTRKLNNSLVKNNNFIYEASIESGTITNPLKIDIPAGVEDQQGVATLSSDGRTMYFTKWNAKLGNKNAAIFYSKKTDGKWSTPAQVEGLNVEGSNTQQPYLMNDATLFFSSNRTGGLGGYDLYKATIQNGTASNIVNLGNIINSEEDDQAPFYHNATNTLIFSSNGRVGMGGFDLFTSKLANQEYTEPTNMGYPVNSVKDDIYFSTNNNSKNILENIIISSDRSADCCLELYSINKDRTPKKISGMVVGCDNKQPVANAIVKFVDAANNVITTQMTDETGKYTFTLDEFQMLKATASSQGLVDGTLNMTIPLIEVDALTNPDICLEKVFPPPPGEDVVLDNIYFEYDKHDLLEESNATLDKLANNMLAHPEVIIEISGHTDSNGDEQYNQRLSQKRAEACVAYLIQKGVDAKRMIAKGYGESKPIADNTNLDGSDNPEGRAKNRRTEFKVIK